MSIFMLWSQAQFAENGYKFTCNWVMKLVSTLQEFECSVFLHEQVKKSELWQSVDLR
jgi:hypothetical protein